MVMSPQRPDATSNLQKHESSSQNTLRPPNPGKHFGVAYPLRTGSTTNSNMLAFPARTQPNRTADLSEFAPSHRPSVFSYSQRTLSSGTDSSTLPKQSPFAPPFRSRQWQPKSPSRRSQAPGLAPHQTVQPGEAISQRSPGCTAPVDGLPFVEERDRETWASG